MDNLSSHRSYPFCQLVAELSGIECPPEQQLCTQAKRVEWLGRQDKRGIIHFTPYHGSWLNWIEFWFGIMGRKVLGESFGSSDELKAAVEAFANEWNLLQSIQGEDVTLYSLRLRLIDRGLPLT